MLIFLHGPDTFSARRKLSEITEKYQSKNKIPTGITHWDCSFISVSDITQALLAPSLFQEKKLYIIENAFLHKEWKEEVLEQDDHIIVFFEQGIPDKRTALYKYLSKKALVQEFTLLEGAKLTHWIQREFLHHGFPVQKDVVDKLAFQVGNDLWQLSNEIQKLVAFGRGVVEKQDIDLLVKQNLQTNIFATIDAIAAKNKKKSLDLIFEHSEKNDSPFYILSMLAYQFRNLLAIKDAKDPRQLKLHPYVLKKSLQAAQLFSKEELERIYKKLFQIDLQTKTGQVDAQMALYVFAGEI
ncbi:DNA polymerase III subunit delta [Patescibacteria group bacterium]|nr:DNA polymerase III subunit delta [Patescibacteria group bacterium]